MSQFPLKLFHLRSKLKTPSPLPTAKGSGVKTGHDSLLLVMTKPLSLGDASSGNPSPIVVQAYYEPPTESPDSIRLLGPLWTASGLTLQAKCRLYCGDHWSTGIIAATGEVFALVHTKDGTSKVTDRRNLQTTEEARLFKNAQARFKRQREKVLSSLGTAPEQEASHG